MLGLTAIQKQQYKNSNKKTAIQKQQYKTAIQNRNQTTKRITTIFVLLLNKQTLCINSTLQQIDKMTLALTLILNKLLASMNFLI
jgi:hypothetical protein